MRNREGGKIYTLSYNKGGRCATVCIFRFSLCRQTGCPFLMNIRENVLFNGINRYLCRTIKKNNIIIINLKNK